MRVYAPHPKKNTPASRTGRARVAAPHKETVPAPATVAKTPAPARYDFSRIPTFSNSRNSSPPELIIAPHGDQHELDAERVADSIVAEPDGLRATEVDVAGPAARPTLAAARRVPIARTPAPNSLLEMNPLGLEEEEGVRRISEGGRPLPAAEREFFEHRLGFDFRRVRLHSDDRAARLSRGLGARAFTIGEHIAFGAAEYAPGTEAGRRLLAHELVHVVQQSSVAAGPALRLQMSRLLDYREGDDQERSVSDAEIRGTNEYKAYMNSELKWQWKYKATPEEALLACRLILQAINAKERVNWEARAKEFLLRARDMLGEAIDEPADSTGEMETAVTHYRVELKAWIPHAHIVDPENELMKVVNPGSMTTYYRGDNHTAYAGSYRALNWVEFDWDGSRITSFTGNKDFGITHKDVIQGGKAINISSGQATKAASHALDGADGFTMTISTTNPLVFTGPAIDSYLEGDVDCEGLQLTYVTDEFPSHGIKVEQDGTVLEEKVIFDASGKSVLGAKGAVTLAQGLSSMTNVGTVSVLSSTWWLCTDFRFPTPEPDSKNKLKLPDTLPP